MEAFLALLAQYGPIAIKYGYPIVKEIWDAVSGIANKVDPTPAQFAALHLLRDQVDEERHRLEGKAAAV